MTKDDSSDDSAEVKDPQVELELDADDVIGVVDDVIMGRSNADADADADVDDDDGRKERYE